MAAPAEALEWRHTLDGVDWQELSALYRVAPLGEKKPADLKTVFEASRFRCFVYEHGELVGAGRALSDGLDCSYICDVAVHPRLQGRGVGQGIVAKLVDFSQGHRKIILYAVAGKEPFYRKLGFRRMKTAMAIFGNEARSIEMGLLEGDEEGLP